eukprot:scaffold383951_cov35-Attheya_sp.AAC.1
MSDPRCCCSMANPCRAEKSLVGRETRMGSRKESEYEPNPRYKDVSSEISRRSGGRMCCKRNRREHVGSMRS